MMAILFGWLRDSTPAAPLVLTPVALEPLNDTQGIR